MKIQFFPTSQEAEWVVDKPIPARLALPEWYKKIPPYQTKTPEFMNNGEVNSTVKKCMCFFDGLTLGYTQLSWSDIHIDQKIDGTTEYTYGLKPQILSHRDKPSIEIPKGFIQTEFAFTLPWIPKTPKGYSTLFIPPINRPDLPFEFYGGVIETDTLFTAQTAAMPFLIKDYFQGIIPNGTPMYQMIPFKRDDWNASYMSFDEGLQKKNLATFRRYLLDGYKKSHWVKKSFE
jgi:hypothetical protein